MGNKIDIKHTDIDGQVSPREGTSHEVLNHDLKAYDVYVKRDDKDCRKRESLPSEDWLALRGVSPDSFLFAGCPDPSGVMFSCSLRRTVITNVSPSNAAVMFVISASRPNLTFLSKCPESISKLETIAFDLNMPAFPDLEKSSATMCRCRCFLAASVMLSVVNPGKTAKRR